MATPTKSGTATPMELGPEQVAQSLKVSLADLSAKATALYAHKNYEEAAEVYAQAAEMQAEMNGEMNPDNAEILFLYGRALFKVGQSKSDVLGGKAPESKKPKPAKKSKAADGNGANKNGESSKGKERAKEPTDAAAHSDEEPSKEEPALEKKPLFHFEGDENFEDSDEEDDEEQEEEDEEDDDLAVAFEILDLARVLLTKKLETSSESETDKGKEVSDGDDPNLRHIKERLADTHDLLAEISYPNAITDSRASLKFKKELYPEESEIVAEAHFKLSLALEFASITKSSDDDAEDNGNGDANASGVVDQALRDEAAIELEAAIASTKLKLQSKEVELATLHNPEDNDVTRQQIADVKELVGDMEQRLVELKKPPVDINAALGIPAPVSTASGSGKPVEEVKKNANDLTGLVRKKRKAEEDSPDEAEPKKVKDGKAAAN
ncbi:hypothetical protein OQA88_6137 [Cercophora sp. LCS_1]